MLALTNPGIYTASGGVSPNITALAIIIGSVGLVLLIWGSVSDAEELAFSALIMFSVCLFTLAIGAAVGDGNSPSKSEYTETVQDWLAADYGIDVNDKDAAKLTDGDELALTLNGTQTAIELIEGEKDTIAVKVVGGSILQPVITTAPAAE